MLSGLAEAFYFAISMSTSGVATLRDLLARTPVALRLLSATGGAGGRFSVGAGGGDLPSLSLPTAASALLLGVLLVVFRAGEDCCRGLIGSFHVVSGTLG